MKRKVRLTEGDLHRIYLILVTILIVNYPRTEDSWVSLQLNNEYFDNKADAYRYAKEQCYDEELQADIYCGEDWIDVVGFVDGQMNQF